MKQRSIENEKASLLLQDLLEAAILTDSGGLVRYMNPLAENLTGWKANEALGKPLEQVFVVVNEETDVMNSSSLTVSIRDRKFLRSKSGAEYWIEYTASLIKKNDAGYVILFRDVTESTVTNEFINRSRKKYKHLVNSIEGVVWEANIETQEYTFVSKYARRLLGYPESEWLGEPSFRSRILHPEDRAWVLAKAANAIAGRENYEMEYRVLAADGSVVWVRDTATVIQESETRHLKGLMVDITERKRKESALLRLEKAAQTMGLGVTVIDLNGKILYTNPADATLHGYSVEELIGKDVGIFAPPEFRHPMTIDQLRKIKKWKRESINKRKDGTLFPVSLISDLIMDASGVPIGIVTTCEDISERKQFDLRLKRSEAQHRQLIVNIPGIVYECVPGATGRWFFVSPQIETILGFSPSEWIEHSGLWYRQCFPQDRERVLAEERRCLETEAPVVCEYRMIARDGRVVWIRDEWTLKQSEFDDQIHFHGIMLDITETRDVEEALHDSKKRYRDLVENSLGMICVHDLEGRLLSVNPACASAVGYAPEEMIGKKVSEFLAPSVRHLFARYMQKLMESGSDTGLLRPVTRSGEERIWTYRNKIFEKHDGERYVLAFAQDVTEFKHAEAALRKAHSDLEMRVHERTAELAKANQALAASEERYRILFEDNPAMYFTLNAKGVVETVNKYGARILGYSANEMVGKSLINLYHQQDQKAALKGLKKALRHPDQLFNWEFRMVRKDGMFLWAKEYARAVTGTKGKTLVLIVCQDITERRFTEKTMEELEEQLRQSQKMEAIGQLAGGVAHDFNNILMAISGYSELLLMNLHPGDPRYQHVTEIRKAMEHGISLTRQLLAFGRKQVLQPKVLDLRQVLGNIQDMLRRLIGEGIDFESLSDPELGRVKADPSQLEQVLINLTVNARDALSIGGKVVIELQNARLSHNNAMNAAPGPYVLLAVSDNGKGMDETTKSRIFEPFFSTKELGKGTGLGLSTVYGIVKQSGGHISVYSEPGMGTTFKIFLPRVDAEIEAGPSSIESAQTMMNTETILLVDDSEPVRDPLTEILRAGGFRVLVATHGEEALEISRNFPDLIHILITDIVMPRMDGFELANKLREYRPEIRVLFMSGYTQELLSRGDTSMPGARFLSKPIPHETLTKTIRELLESPLSLHDSHLSQT